MVASRVRAISGHDRRALSDGWEVAAAPAGSIADPSALARAALDWTNTTVPATAASALRSVGRWSLDGAPRRFDADDWWFRVRFDASAAGHAQSWLCFDGLATLADVWLNGVHVLTSDGMFTAHERRVDEHLRGSNELVIVFRSLDSALKERRARPRWRAPMVEHQQLRWHRTTLLGRTPGWSPPAQPVGPWRAVRLEHRRGVAVSDLRIRADGDGRLAVSLHAPALGGAPLDAGEIILTRADQVLRGTLAPNGSRLSGEFHFPDAVRWWPHTHGEPALYSARLRLQRGSESIGVDVGDVGFRTVTVDTTDNGFAVHVNGARVFCRGGCWTPLDPVALNNSIPELDAAFRQLVDAGMNMVRVGGMMVYEDDAFLDRCDAFGVLLWQDFMFANMEYPQDDPRFAELVTEEARQLLLRLQARPSVAVLCGNSEGEQQAAMWGAPRSLWQPSLFTDRLARLSADLCPGVPYWPSSTHGGAFPHQANAGSASYYGVGAYLRPIDDARRADVRFASECLAFANIPDPQAMTDMPGGRGVKVHDPAWKARTPRDLGAGWDFDDVRDHYVADLFRVDPLQLRYADHERYLDLGRVVSGEVMARVFSEWRRRDSRCGGGIIWFLRDLWHGAGWGVVDAAGRPKSAWHYLRRALAPVAVSLSDEGGNGIAVHVANDRPTPFAGQLEVALFRFGEVRVAGGSRDISVEPRSALELNAAAVFDDFLDLSYAYRFGPPSHDVIIATLVDQGRQVGRAFQFVPGLPNTREMDVGLSADARRAGEGYELVIRTRKLAVSVSLDIDGFVPQDNHFHLAPGEERRVALAWHERGATPGHGPRGVVRALNSATAATVVTAPVQP